jgi:uncharacterized BrkB/YihY/UPF0761 family membrane protein
MKILVCVGLVMVGRGGGSAAVVTMVFLFFLICLFLTGMEIHATIRNWRLP